MTGLVSFGITPWSDITIVEEDFLGYKLQDQPSLFVLVMAKSKILFF